MEHLGPLNKHVTHVNSAITLMVMTVSLVSQAVQIAMLIIPTTVLLVLKDSISMSQ